MGLETFFSDEISDCGAISKEIVNVLILDKEDFLDILNDFKIDKEKFF